MTSKELRDLYEKESGKRWMDNPICHGEVGYASWDYQIWLENKSITIASPQVCDELAERIVFVKGKLGFIVMKKFGETLIPITDESELELIGKRIQPTTSPQVEQSLDGLDEKKALENFKLQNPLPKQSNFEIALGNASELILALKDMGYNINSLHKDVINGFFISKAIQSGKEFTAEDMIEFGKKYSEEVIGYSIDTDSHPATEYISVEDSLIQYRQQKEKNK